MAGGQIVELAVGDEFLSRSPERTRLRIADTKLPAQDVVRRNFKLRGEQGMETPVIVRAVPGKTEHQRQFGLLVELEAIFVHLAIHVNRQVGQAEQRLGKMHQAHFDAVTVTHGDPAGKAQVTVGKGRQDRPAIDLDAKSQQAIPVLQRLRLDAQPGRVGMRADQPETAFGQSIAADHEGNDRRAPANHEVTPAGRQLPALVLAQRKETAALQAVDSCLHGVPGTGADVDEIQEVAGLFPGLSGYFHDLPCLRVNGRKIPKLTRRRA